MKSCIIMAPDNKVVSNRVDNSIKSRVYLAVNTVIEWLFLAYSYDLLLGIFNLLVGDYETH